MVDFTDAHCWRNENANLQNNKIWNLPKKIIGHQSYSQQKMALQTSNLVNFSTISVDIYKVKRSERHLLVRVNCSDLFSFFQAPSTK